MYNPRNSFISTGSTATYASTLSVPTVATTAPFTPPASPGHSSRLHRSSKRNLRTSASVTSLNTIGENQREDVARAMQKKRSSALLGGGKSREGQRQSADITPLARSPERKGGATVHPLPSRPVSQSSSYHRDAQITRPTKAHVQPSSSAQTSTQTRPPSHGQPSSQSRSTPQPQARGSTSDELRSQSIRPSTGLGLSTGATPRPRVRDVENRPVAQPRKPEPIDVNPKKKESMADEWERELIQSAKEMHISLPAQQADKDIAWEKSGRWQADVDPTREAEDRTRRDANREIAYPPAQPRLQVRAAPTGVTSIHIGIRPRLHPSRANSSMSMNQPDETLPYPAGSPLGDSYAHNLPGARAELAEKAKAEYESWLARKEERESGIGQPHDYNTLDWALRGREPARPAALMNMATEPGPSNFHSQIPPPLKAPQRVTFAPPPQMPPPPIMVHPSPVDIVPSEPIMVTPVDMAPGSPQYPVDNHHLGTGGHAGHRGLSAQPSMENMNANYFPAPQAYQGMPYESMGSTEGDDMMNYYNQYPYPHPYPYPPHGFDRTYGYPPDPAIYRQFYNPNTAWYGPRWDPNAYQWEQQGEGSVQS